MYIPVTVTIWFAILLMIPIGAARTWMTPVIEAMMVAEQKKYLTSGSDDLYTFS
jgi:hypothetical protein